MSLPKPDTDIVRLDLRITSENYRYRVPIKFGGRVVEDATVLNVEAACQTRCGKRIDFPSGGIAPIAGPVLHGFGSMTLGVAWAWPDPSVSDQTRLHVVNRLCERFVADTLENDPTGHPLEICHRQSLRREAIAHQVAGEFELQSPIPALAVLLAASPIEAAIFDVHGKAAGRSSFALLGRDFVSSDLSEYLGPAYRGLYLDRFVSVQPKPTMPLYHLVGALDPLTEADVSSPAGDGLPETLGQWIVRDGLTHLKIKLAGDDLAWDVQRVIGVHRAADTCGRPGKHPYTYSLDFNERCENESYVLELLDQIASQDASALGCVAYIEQPTHRDLAAHPENTMHRVAERLPVVIDESLVDLASLRLAVEQGYSGVALKACKGHSEALLMAAVAQHENLYLCVQDLTCIGASLLHSASLAAHIPKVAAIESNGRQYCPSGNAGWRDHYPQMFDVQGGVLPTSCLNGAGLGY
jgi:L-alanine-DL-glutamate epimerase-like enolase superfamily enzyme